MEKQPWKSDRKIAEERHAAIIDRGNVLCDMILDGIIEPETAREIHVHEFGELAIKAVELENAQ